MSDHFVADPGRAQPADKAALIELIGAGWEELEQAIAGLSHADLEARPEGGWSVCDHLGHVAAWERGTVALLEGRPRHAAMGVEAELLGRNDDDATNERLQQLGAERPAPETLAELRDAHAALVACLGGLTDEALARPYGAFRVGEPDDGSAEPALARLVPDTYGHYVEHAACIRALRGGERPVV